MNKKIVEDNLILKFRCGSNLYGTTTEGSDEDFVGVFIAPIDYQLGVYKVEEVDLSHADKLENGRNSKYAIDFKCYELKKFIRLLKDNNPNILELIFADKENILYCNNYGKMLLDNKYLFPHQGLYHRFLGYAHSQRKKMEIKSNNYLSFKKFLEDFSLNDEMILESLRHKSVDYINFNKKDKTICTVGDINFPVTYTIKKCYQQITKRINQYGSRKNLINKSGYDTKFASHLIRLLYEVIELMQTGKLEFPLEKRDILLKIKNGGCSLKDVLNLDNKLNNYLEEIKDINVLPKTCDLNKINELQIDMIKRSII
jgi:predicted nucleotidyltransferase